MRRVLGRKHYAAAPSSADAKPALQVTGMPAKLSVGSHAGKTLRRFP